MNKHMELYRQQMTDTLCKLIAVPSEKGQAEEGKPFGPGPAKALDLFLEEANRLGFRTGRSQGYAGWLEFGSPSAPMIGVVCHLDVVPAQGWPDAYTPRVEDGKIIGRGSMDDKGPAVAAMYAMKDLMDNEGTLPCRIRLILGLDEESGSACMAHYTKQEELPLAAFTADAEFPVIHAEKGHWCFTLNWSKELPTDRKVLWSADCGSRGNVIPGEATFVLRNPDGSFEKIEAVGKMGHASMPEFAQNAIQLAFQTAQDKILVAGSHDDFVDSFLQVVGSSYTGAELGLAGSDEESGALTLNVGILQYAEGTAKVRIDIRYPVTWKIEELQDKLYKRLADTGFTVSEESNSDPLYRPLSDPLVEILMNAYQTVSGRTEQPIAIGGGTYARSVPNTLAFGPTFPEDENLCHQKGENIRETTLMTSAEIYRQALMDMANHYQN